jgi:CubicO group peptidase (beta-lactamase class C family)
VFDFFPEYADLRTPAKEMITIDNLLTMSAGLEWDQTSYDDDDPRNDEEQLSRSNDGVRFTLQKPVVINPGVSFNYSSGNSDVLAAIVDHATQMPTDIFAEITLFDPLRIQNYGWRKANNNFVNAGYGLHMLPRDVAKIGQLYLDSGFWKGAQIVSRSWIKRSTEKRISVPNSPNQGYGFQWWTRDWFIDGRTISAFQAQGSGGQVICVLPELNAVVVITGANNGSLSYNLLEQYLLPALIGE